MRLDFSRSTELISERPAMLYLSFRQNPEMDLTKY
jgi:hypothetical protein